MKKLGLAVFVFGVLFLSYAIAQVPSVAPSAVPVVSAPAASPGFIDFVKANVAAIALAVYAILDVIILAVPSLSGNGLVHQFLILAAKLSNQSPPA